MQVESSEQKFRFVWRFAFVAALLLVLLVSVVPVPTQTAPEFSDKAVHAACYFLLAVLYAWGFARGRLRLGPLLALAAYGLLIEVLQFFLPWRSFSLADGAANLSGLLSYQLLYVLLPRGVSAT